MCLRVRKVSRHSFDFLSVILRIATAQAVPIFTVNLQQQVCISFPAVSEVYHGEEAVLLNQLISINYVDVRNRFQDHWSRGVPSPEGAPIHVTPTKVVRESPLRELPSKVYKLYNALAESSADTFTGYLENRQRALG